jgi:biopolymer transport protein ExbD
VRVPSSTTSRGEVGFNMTPMIDVVFQLIIFFLLSSHMSQSENNWPLPLPQADSGQEEPNDPNQPKLTINVLVDGTILLAGTPVTAADLPARLKDRVQQLGTDVEVRIRGDRGVSYKHLTPVMLSCTQAGIWRIAIAVQERDTPR